jgi:hypothetical protein
MRTGVATIAAVVVIIFAVGFPPFRRAGDWRDEATGEPADSSIAGDLDRWYFGDLPHFDWVGIIGAKVAMEPGCTVTLPGRRPYECSRYTLVVDSWWVSAEVILLAALAFPFVRFSRRDPPSRLMNRRFAPVSIIVLAGLLAAALGWYLAATLVSDDFTGVIQIAASLIGLWAGMFLGVAVARRLFPDPRSDDGRGGGR